MKRSRPSPLPLAPAAAASGVLLTGLAGCGRAVGQTLDPIAAIYLGAVVLLAVFVSGVVLLARASRARQRRSGTDQDRTP